MKYILTLLFVFTLTLFAKPLERTQVLMGTYASIALPSSHSSEITNGFALIRQIEMSLSSYNPNAKLYQLNSLKEVQKDPFLLEVIIQSIDLYRLTHGYFDITIGSLTKKLYHFGEKEQIPSQEEIKNAKLDINGILIKDKTIALKPNITIDLGGIGKGYAVDKVAGYFRQKNINSGVIALSGDIRVINPSTIFIQSPFKNEANLKLQTLLHDISISTSGTYRRYIQNRSNHHLINPKTKEQGRAFVSVTLITINNNTLIDAYATAVGVMSELKALKFLLNHPKIGFILIKPNGNILYGNLDTLVQVLNL